MAYQIRKALSLGYSGGAVPDSESITNRFLYRSSLFVGRSSATADHQRTPYAPRLSEAGEDVKPSWQMPKSQCPMTNVE